MESKWWEFPTLSKAQDFAVWEQFAESSNGDTFYVVDGPEHYSVVNQSMLEELGGIQSYPLKTSYADLQWQDMESLYQDEDPLFPWEELIGIFQTMDGTLLRFILAYRIPLPLFVCYTLACRGYDSQKRWVGFDTSDHIWREVYEKLKT